jgi:hypothetical protein
LLGITGGVDGMFEDILAGVGAIPPDCILFLRAHEFPIAIIEGVGLGVALVVSHQFDLIFKCMDLIGLIVGPYPLFQLFWRGNKDVRQFRIGRYA